MKDKVFDLIPKEGNLAGNTYAHSPSPAMNKGSMTEVPQKSLTDEQAKMSAKAQKGTGTFNGSQVTGSGRRAD